MIDLALDLLQLNENDNVIDVKFAFDKAQQLYQVGRFRKVNILFRPLKIRLGTIL